MYSRWAVILPEVGLPFATGLARSRLLVAEHHDGISVGDEAPGLEGLQRRGAAECLEEALNVLVPLALARPGRGSGRYPRDSGVEGAEHARQVSRTERRVQSLHNVEVL
jgi:hypothetical protein